MSAQPEPSTVLLSVSGLSKTFPGHRALVDLSLEVGAGEVVALSGENGSGKSTLVKILAGYHSPDPGATLRLGGSAFTPGSPEAKGRMRFVHQDSALIDDMTVLENLCIVRGFPRRSIRIDWKGAAAWASERLRGFGFQRDVRTPVRSLSPAERAILMIVRAVEGWDASGGILVLDEPTAFLHSSEVDRMLAAVRVVAASGAGVILISHRMEDLYAVADRVVVLRDGRVVENRSVHSITEEELVVALAGRAIVSAHGTEPSTPGDVVLSVRALAAQTLRGISFELRAGEILGITGPIGSGQEMVCKTLFGAQVRESGEILLEGSRLELTSPHAAIRAGLAYVPADRARSGCVLGLTVRENMTLPKLRNVTRHGPVISRRLESSDLEPWFERLRITSGSGDWPMSLLSGGNQQKAVMAKWLRLQPRVLLLDEPTNGVDVAARVTILDMLRDVVGKGAAAVVSSMNATELAETCDRVLVLADGVCVADLDGDSLTSSAITEASYGLSSIGSEL